jgi:acyl carrier protein
MENKMSNEVLKALEPIFRDVFEEPDLVVTRELNANDVENWDSLNHIALIVEIEMLTNISFSIDQLLDMSNVGDFADMLVAEGFLGDA